MIETRSSAESHGSAVWFSEEHTPLQHYLIVRYSRKGLELPEILSDSGEEILPVFCSEEAAQKFLSSSSLGEGWYVREFSKGELVSTVFTFHTRLKGILLDPQPGALSGGVAVSVVGRDTFVSSLLEARSYTPAVGAHQ